MKITDVEKVANIFINKEIESATFWKRYEPLYYEWLIQDMLNVITEEIDYTYVSTSGTNYYGMICYYSKILEKNIILANDYDFRGIENITQFVKEVKEFEKEAEAIELKIKNGVSDDV